MNNASLELGGTNWAEKDASLLGYTVSDDSGRFSPQEFTFSRGSNLAATRIGKTGLIEKGRENLLTHSNNFSNSDWTNSNITLTSGQEDPFGGSNGWRYLMIGGIGNSYLYQNNKTINGSVMVLSFWVKSNTGSNQTFRATANSGTQSSPDFTATTSWQRFSWFFISNAGNSNILLAYNPSTNSDLLIYGAQFEQGLVATPYIPTTTTSAQAGVLENTPRLNYTTGVANPYLLLEPSRSNLVVNSEYINNSASGWSTFFDTNITNNAATSPDGANNATEVACPIGGSARIDCVNNGLAVGTYTYTFYAKGNVSSLYLNAYEDATGTTLSSTSISALINDSNWSRIDVTFTTTAISTIRMIINSLLSGESFYIYGAQLEEGSYATSYIPTYSVSATRAQDTCSKTDASGEINSTEGVLYFEGSALALTSSLEMLSLNDGTYNNIVLFRYYDTSSNDIQFQVKVGGSLQASILFTLSDAKAFNKIALKYKENDFALWVNGAKVGTDTSGTTFSANTLNKLSFNRGDGSNPLFGKVNALQVYKEALTDAELATLTTI